MILRRCPRPVEAVVFQPLEVHEVIKVGQRIRDIFVQYMYLKAFGRDAVLGIGRMGKVNIASVGIILILIVLSTLEGTIEIDVWEELGLLW